MNNKINIVQLYGVDGQDVALFSFDPERTKEHDVPAIINNAVEAAFKKDEAGELEDGDVLTEAVEQLEKNFGIIRVYATVADTDRL